MQNAIVEVVCVGSGSNKTYNSIYTDPGCCKMVIVQDDDKFPSPRLCLLRKWPNFENGLSFGFDLYEDLLNSTGFLKIEEVTRNSPAEAGGLRKNDVIIEINGDNVEYKSFFRLIEICKEAFSKSEMELLVLAEQDAEWYRIRNICVNSNFPNIEYCETPYYGYILKPLDCYQVPAGAASAASAAAAAGPGQKVATSQIEFHSSTGKLFRTTLVIDKNKDSVYKRVEELPTGTPENLAGTLPPMRPDGTFRHPGSDNSLRVYYRPERGFLARTASTGALQQGGGAATSDENFHTAVDSGFATMTTTNRRSTPLSAANMAATMSPYSTIDGGKGTINVDLLHDKWGDLMDKYLDDKYRSTQSPLPNESQDNKDSISKRSYVIPLNDPKGSSSSSNKRSRAQSPNDTFSYLYSGRDMQTSSAGSFGPSSAVNRKPSPFNYLAQRGAKETQSQRFPSPHQSVASPTRTRQPSQPRPPAQQQQVENQQQQPHQTTTTTRENVRPVNTSSGYEQVIIQKPNIIYSSEYDQPSRPSVALAEVSHQHQQPPEESYEAQQDFAVETAKYESIDDDYGSTYNNAYPLSEPSSDSYLPSEPAPDLPRTPPPTSSSNLNNKKKQQQAPITIQRDIDREIELQQQREKEYFEQRERDREQREREAQQQQPSLKPLVAGIASALAYTAQQQPQQVTVTTAPTRMPEPQRTPHIWQEEQIETTTKTTYIQQKFNEEIVQEHSDGAGKLRESLETEIISSSTYLPDDVELEHYVDRNSVHDLDRQDEFFKQQKVMESLVTAMNTNEELLGRLRTYDVYKRDNFFGYGIAFHTESTPPSQPSHKLVYPFIEVEPDTPAEEAGLKYGQRVVAVNGAFVNRELKTLDDVVQAIEDSYYNRSFTTITVLDPVMWQDFMANPNLAADLARPQSRPPFRVEQVDPLDSSSAPARTCYLEKSDPSVSYGFDFKTLKNECKHVAHNVKPGFPAERAGLKNGDHILKVNGSPIDGIEHETVVRMIGNDPKRVELVVASGPQIVDTTPVQQPAATQPMLPTAPQPPQVIRPPSPVPTYDGLIRFPIRLIPEFQGFGISLSPNSNGVISKIEPNSPAAKAGLEVNHQIVEVNSASVRGNSNKEIKEIIGQNKDNLVLGVVKVAPTTPAGSRDQSKVDARPAIQTLVDDQTPTHQPRPAKSETNLSVQGDGLKDARVCELVRRPDFAGYGFSIHKNPRGPHQITNVEPNSPAFASGLKNDDLLLKVNDIDVVGENYTKTILKIKNESERDRFKLTVIDPLKCPSDIKNKALEPTSGYSTISSSTKKQPKPMTASSGNLKTITREMIDSSGPTTARPVSADRQSTSTASGSEKQRSKSSIDLSRQPAVQPAYTSSSVRDVSAQPPRTQPAKPSDRPKFKVCSIEKAPNETFGFALNRERGPKHTIHSVEEGSPADRAFVKKDDIILRINKQYVRNKNFDKIRDIIKKASTDTQKIELLLIDLDGFKYWKSRQKKFKKLDTFAKPEDFEYYSSKSGRQASASPGRVGEPSQVARLPAQPPVRAPVPSDDESSRRSNSVTDVRDKSMREPSPSASVSTPAPTRRPPAVESPMAINRELYELTIYRRPDEKLGMNLSDAKPGDYGEGKACPFVNSVTPGSAADQAGLKQGDIVIVVNGVPTAGKKAASLAPLMKGDVNEITIGREKEAVQRVVEMPVQQPVQNVIVTTPAQPSPSEIYEPNNTSQLSRTSSTSSRSTQQGTPKLSQYEEKQSSSKLQFPDSQRPRNQSEPAPIDRVSVTQTNQGNTGVTSSPALSKRSASVYNLPVDAPIPRLCRVKAYEPNLGFIVLGSKQHEGTYKINEIVPNSPAAHSGLQNQDIIIEVSGVNVLNMRYDQVVDLIKAKKNENDLQLLVVDKQTLEWYKSKKIPISSRVVPMMQYIETFRRSELDDLDREQNGPLSGGSAYHLNSYDDGNNTTNTTQQMPQPYSGSSSSRNPSQTNLNEYSPTPAYTTREVNRPTTQPSQPSYGVSELAPNNTTREIKIPSQSGRAIRFEGKIYISTTPPLNVYPSSD